MRIQSSLAAPCRQNRHYNPHIIAADPACTASESAHSSPPAANDATRHARCGARLPCLHSFMARRVGKHIHITAHLVGGNDRILLAVVDDAAAAALCEQINVAVRIPSSTA